MVKPTRESDPTSIVILLGLKGAGKGVQAQFLESSGYKVVGIGNFLRAQRSKGLLPKECARMMDENQLLPDHLIIPVVRAELDALPAGSRIVLDGFPRNLAQGRMLTEAVSGLSRKRSGVSLRAIEIFVTDDVSRARRMKRRREDDQDEIAIEKAIAAYWRDISPLMRHLRNHCRLDQVDGMQDADAVAGKISALLCCKREKVLINAPAIAEAVASKA